MSALHGDNVVESSCGWTGTRPAAARAPRDVELPAAVPARCASRSSGCSATSPATGARYAGRVAGGELRPGAEVVALPVGPRARVISVETLDGPLEAAPAGQSVAVRIDRELDLGRGDMLVAAESAPVPTREIEADVCWLAEAPLRPGARLRAEARHRVLCARSSTRCATASTSRPRARARPDGLALNDIGRVRLRVSRPLPVEPYAANRVTGAFILIDEGTNDTVGAGMVA